MRFASAAAAPSWGRGDSSRGQHDKRSGRSKGGAAAPLATERFDDRSLAAIEPCDARASRWPGTLSSARQPRSRTWVQGPTLQALPPSRERRAVGSARADRAAFFTSRFITAATTTAGRPLERSRMLCHLGFAPAAAPTTADPSSGLGDRVAATAPRRINSCDKRSSSHSWISFTYLSHGRH